MRRVPCALLLAALATTAADAQARSNLTVAGWPLATTSTAASDFEAGGVALGATTFTVDLVATTPPLTTRGTSVEVQCVPACPRSGTLPLAGVQWRRSDQATWTTLTTAYVLIESRTATFNGANDPWSRTMYWRYALTWAGNPPTAASQFRVSFRLVVAAP
jgi:hypothetical protein